MGDQVNSNTGDKLLDDSEHGQIEALKSEVKSLHGDIDKMLDSIKQTTATQNQLARATLAAKEIADAAMAELAKNKTELAAAKLEMQKSINESITPAIKAGMIGFVEEVKKSTDERITAILGQQNQPASDGSAQPPAQDGRDIFALLKYGIDNAEGIGKLVSAVKGTQSPNAVLADDLARSYRIIRTFKELGDVNVDVATFDKKVHEALTVPQAQPKT